MAARGQRPRRRRSRGSDLGARILVAIPAAAFAILIVVLGGAAFTVALIALGFVCIHELCRMFADERPARLAGFLGVAALPLAAHFGDLRQVLLALVLAIAVSFLLTIAGPRQEEDGVRGLMVTVLGIVWIGLGLAHAVLLRDLPHGEGIVLDVLVGTFLGDTGAYLGGRAFGRRPLAPTISPNKSVEGLVFGIVVAFLATWFAGLYQDWLSGVDAALLGIGVALTAPVGDLFESFVKRGAQTKDAGGLFGAHGGALDRLDAVLFTVVAGYYIWFAML